MGEHQAVVQSVCAALPELDLVRPHEIAAPMWRERNVFAWILFLEVLDCCLQRTSFFQRFTLS